MNTDFGDSKPTDSGGLPNSRTESNDSKNHEMGTSSKPAPANAVNDEPDDQEALAATLTGLRSCTNDGRHFRRLQPKSAT